jgi:hypothetical protein
MDCAQAELLVLLRMAVNANAPSRADFAPSLWERGEW